MSKLSQTVKDKIAEAVTQWAYENLDGKPALYGTALYFSVEKVFTVEANKILEATK